MKGKYYGTISNGINEFEVTEYKGSYLVEDLLFEVVEYYSLEELEDSMKEDGFYWV